MYLAGRSDVTDCRLAGFLPVAVGFRMFYANRRSSSGNEHTVTGQVKQQC